MEMVESKATMTLNLTAGGRDSGTPISGSNLSTYEIPALHPTTLLVGNGPPAHTYLAFTRMHDPLHLFHKSSQFLGFRRQPNNAADHLPLPLQRER